MNRKLNQLLSPTSIAILGASNKEDSVGSRLVKNIIEGNYKGQVFPINPKYQKCQGIKCYPSVKKLPLIPDLLIIAIPAKAVFDAIKECNEFGIKNFYIISSGFSELGAEGKYAQQQISEYAKTNKLNIIGPNTIGFINNDISLNANFAQAKSKNGKTVLISQSGALTSGIMNILNTTHIGLKYVISIGNACDVNIHDLINYFNNDTSINQILLYLESVPYPTEFMKACQKSSKNIICIKSGRSTTGAKAALSHTGALASSDTIVDTFLAQSNVIRVDSISQMANLATIYETTENYKKSKNIVVITNAGGPAVLTVDALSNYGFNLYEFKENQKEYLKSYLQKQASVNNPIDMVASASVEDYKKTLEYCLKIKNVDTIICIHLYIMGTKSIEMAKIMEDCKLKYPNKLVAGVFITSEENVLEIKNKITSIPIFNSGEDVAKTISLTNNYRNNSKPKCSKIDNQRINTIINNAKAENRNLLTTIESLEVLKELKLPVVNYTFVKDFKEAKKNSKNIQYPVAIKITSKTITHKSDVGGVKIGINNKNELLKAIDEIKQNLTKNNCINGLDGFLIQEMKSSKREFVYGIIEDSQFGLCSMFGLGGIFVEAFKDVSFKILPTNSYDLDNQINSLKSSSLLKNIRNLPQANLEELKNIMLTINNFAISYNIKELDLNPIIIDDITGNNYLIDARIKI